MRPPLVLAAATALATLALAAAAPAAPGEFDRGFAENGVFRLADSVTGAGFGAANRVATDAFGNVLASGSANGREVVVRLLPTGRPDPGFSDGGVLVSTPSVLVSHWGLGALPAGIAPALLVRAEKFACFGPGASFCVLAPAGVTVRRIDAAGNADPGYAPPQSLIAGASGTEFEAIATPDGSFLYAGFVAPLTSGIRLGRLDPQGRPDEAFDANARAATSCRAFPADRAAGVRLLRQADGRILVAQSFHVFGEAAGDRHGVCVVRLEANGARDASYGSQGELSLDSLLFTSAPNRLVALLPLAGGGAALVLEQQYAPPVSIRYAWVIAWITPEGALDAAKPGGGISGPSDLHVGRVEAAAIQADGKILLAGYPGLAEPPPAPGYDASQPRVGRLHSLGGADLAYGPSGTGYAPLLTFGSRLIPRHLHLDAEGNLLVAGALGEAGPVNASESTRFAVARLRGDEPPRESGSGGGGCGLVTGAPFDPTLPGLAALALGALALRRRLLAVRPA